MTTGTAYLKQGTEPMRTEKLQTPPGASLINLNKYNIVLQLKSFKMIKGYQRTLDFDYTQTS